MVSCRLILPKRWSRDKYLLWLLPAMAIVNSMFQRCSRHRVYTNQSIRKSWFAHSPTLSAPPIDLHKTSKQSRVAFDVRCWPEAGVAGPVLADTALGGIPRRPV